ncbi:hypothetical protein K449DRAFT_399265 [Hypoxylon sp. EC38]|nr:hypothetical protein K449DRAFT_399265 [Hypoxylon sp. EC38]
MASDFASSYIKKLSTSMHHRNTSKFLKPSASERSRIMRALYTLEIFQILFCHTWVFDQRDVAKCMNEFLLNFAPWEIEQIACVHDFLMIQISPAFYAKTDTNFWEDPDLVRSDLGVNAALSQGLVNFESVAKSNTFNEQYYLKYGGGYRSSYPRAFYHALRDIDLVEIGYLGYHVYNYVSVYRGPRQYARRVKPPFFDDPDGGPFRVWRQLYKSKALRFSVYQMDEILWERAYVMWDRERLEALGMIKYRPQQPPTACSSLSKSLPKETDNKT